MLAVKKMLFDTRKSVTEKYTLTLPSQEQALVYIKRDDLIDEWVSGNKWRKLKYNIEQANKLSKEGILTFGGAFSNHLLATAKACDKAGLESVGVVRGEELSANSNPTLKNCSALGMKLIFISRSEYKNRNDYAYLAQWKDTYNSLYVVPEGGANFYGVVGCQEIIAETTNDFDHVFVAAGTGTTAAGVLTSISAKTKVHVVETLKGDFLKKNIETHVNQVYNNEKLTKDILENCTFIADRFGGYAKWNKELVDFVQFFHRETGVKLDLIYTGKVLYAWMQKVMNGEIHGDDKVLFIHSGGLQGMSEINKKIGFQLYN